MTKLKPLEDRVIVESIEEEEESSSGFYFPESVKSKPSRGRVVAVGEGKILDNGDRGPMDFSEGDIVYFLFNSPSEITVNEDEEIKTYYVLNQIQILAVKK